MLSNNVSGCFGRRRRRAQHRGNAIVRIQSSPLETVWSEQQTEHTRARTAPRVGPNYEYVSNSLLTRARPSALQENTLTFTFDLGMLYTLHNGGEPRRRSHSNLRQLRRHFIRTPLETTPHNYLYTETAHVHRTKLPNTRCLVGISWALL